MGNAGKIVIVVAAALGLAACTNDQHASSYSAGDGPVYPVPSPAVAAAPSSAAVQSGAPARACTADDVKVTGDFGSKPTITIPDTCTAPATLLTKSLVAGKGTGVSATGTLQVNFDLVTWSDKVDQQSDFGLAPLPVALGRGEVIPGWDQGLAGIKQGERRLLVIPPSLGYGATGSQKIKPNETLVFVVDAVQVSG